MFDLNPSSLKFTHSFKCIMFVACDVFVCMCLCACGVGEGWEGEFTRPLNGIQIITKSALYNKQHILVVSNTTGKSEWGQL